MSCDYKRIGLPKINTLLKILKSNKYIIYDKPFQLNIIGVRNLITNPEKFDDFIYVIFKNDNNNWEGYRFNATTDPSTRYLEKGGFSSSSSGTAILPQGQYVDTWRLGTHKGYRALVQNKKICVYRDYDRNDTLNFNIEDKDCGLFGINIHRGKSHGADDGNGNTEFIGLYSAGCQVFANYYCFNEFMDLAEKQKNLYGNAFTYTLIDKSLQRKFIVKRSIFFLGLILGGFMIYKGVKSLRNAN